MARNAAAMPQLVCRNCLRLKPRCLPFTSASSLIRASTFFWIALCGGGRYSPLDTIWVGMGVGADAASAPATRRCSRSLSHVLIVLLPFLLAVTLLGGARLAAPNKFGGPMRFALPVQLRMKLQLASRPGETLHCFLRKRRHTRNLRWWCITGDFNAQTFIGASDVARQSHCPNAAPLALRAISRARNN